ncbi:hypothetical protein Tsubulata_019542 [Turnera subulata]|uniref:Uncharacterized protein n=1 Tax=Turnera subulata TaxID=218843 RepID=A0A9Q0FE54_9ROSI|nr:hypothetical protein Tsubulata_019542 [Turnera subulata]
MGAKLCKDSSSAVHYKNHNSSSHNEFLKPDCLKPKKAKKKRQLVLLPSPRNMNGKAMSKLSTLEDWILDSPSYQKQEYCKRRNDLYAIKNSSSKRVHPSSTTGTGELFSLEQLVMLDHLAEKQYHTTSSTSSSISRSQKQQKRVRFKLPEEADILLFYSPKDSSLETDY